MITSAVSLTCINLLLCFLRVSARAATSSQSLCSTSPDQCQRKCTTAACLAEAARLIDIIDESVDPCDNFYQFVCGNFMKKQNISDESITINPFSIAQSKILRELFRELRERVKPNELSAFKKVKIFYENCINVRRIERDGTEPFFKIFRAFGGWPVLQDKSQWDENTWNWSESINKLGEKFILIFPVIIAVQPDNRNSSRNIIKLLSFHDALLATFLDNSDNDLYKAYRDFMINVTVKLGANRDFAKLEMQKVLEFEKQFYQLSKLKNETETESYISIKDLSNKYSAIPWLKVINDTLSEIVIDETEIISVVNADFLPKLEDLLKTTPQRVIANYLGWQIVRSILPFSPRDFRNSVQEFQAKIDGAKKSIDFPSQCLNEIMQLFPIAIGSMYIRRNFNKQMISNVSDMIEHLRRLIGMSLQAVDWMDDKTRTAALEKLSSMNFSIGYVEELMNDVLIENYYKDLQIHRGSSLESALNVTRFLYRHNQKKLRKKARDVSNWTFNQNVAWVNAFYTLRRNTIEIPLGFLRAFYRSNRPQYLNYGSVASSIAHEIFHGFDTHGRKYDKYGNENNWWDTATEKEFFKKTECFIDQYNNFTVKEVGLNVNGVVTQAENIADNGGFRAAYYAYNDYTISNKITEPGLANLDYTPKQLFWISAASTWCSKKRPEYLKNLLSSDTHSPENARVIISFSNVKEFAQDFKCPLGSRMNPEKKCVIW
ncbi:neprilysin-2-like [Trichogramma pretiosum]|uniref:neprilysin-2-like n=1 Tax=Trichogramma pretiosum TaxID=7493 RepID=UPI0006C9DEE3|nr:neprilysin-2-like [Trichogramma pretiosum]